LWTGFGKVIFWFCRGNYRQSNCKDYLAFKAKYEGMTLTKKMVIDWKSNYRFVAKNEKGLTADFDAPKHFGGEESAL
jgi:hypothetical protein